MPMMVAIGNFDGGRKLLNYLEYIKKVIKPKHPCTCAQTSDKSQWCYPRGYKNYVLPMDVARHDFDLG